MKILLATFISFFCQAGTLTNYQTNVRYKLECPDPKYQSCFFDIELPIGDYLYVSNDKKDTTIFIIEDSKFNSHIYKTTGNFIFTY